jgi:hypothetical protein
MATAAYVRKLALDGVRDVGHHDLQKSRLTS